jgi:hypothetical protein
MASFALALALLIPLLLLLLPLDYSPLHWSTLQLLKSLPIPQSLTPSLPQYITHTEHYIWSQWEQQSKFQPNETLLQIPTYTTLSHTHSSQSINFNLPFLIQNVTQEDILSLQSLSSSPLSELQIDYFSDAREQLLVPDEHDSLGSIVNKILSGGPQKIGSQMIVQKFPDIMKRCIAENRVWLSEIFGEKRVQMWYDLGVTVTVPVFVSRGISDSSSGKSLTTRTDLHCEPISNVVFQTAG